MAGFERGVTVGAEGSGFNVAEFFGAATGCGDEMFSGSADAYGGKITQ